ncbi:acetyl-CoA carboxylase biotin carboxylase subunit [Nocardiopsis coralliicola]
MGIRTVAVLSAADEEAAVARVADQVVRIGPAQPRRSYLSIPALVEAALQSGAEAIHPGYGFLSEDPDFAEVCAARGLAFIGPPLDVMARLGDKAEARRIMAAAGLPVPPGTEAIEGSAADAKRRAGELGYPLMVKAAAGGGGRGMAPVRGPREFVRVFRETQAAARSLFGDGRVYLERLVESARHIEVQVLCDQYGNGVHLGERDCSVQRRNQKLVEESPAAGCGRALLDRMCETAVKAALSCGFTGVGTFEFLLDGDEFYFMEINTRIQVEHPVTEMVVGRDLVREQIRVAAGQPLGFGQHEVDRYGAAIECRINAEDTERGFLPAPGTLTRFHPPGGPFVRVDTDAYQGYRIPSDYDPLVAKVIAWGRDRDEAIARMDRALGEFAIDGPGVHTTSGLLRRVVADPRFRHAKHTTALLQEMDLDDA